MVGAAGGVHANLCFTMLIWISCSSIYLVRFRSSFEPYVIMHRDVRRSSSIYCWGGPY